MYQGFVYSSNPQVAGLQQQYGYNYPLQVPLTPLDLSYSQSMLPANLLASSPSPYLGRQFFQQPPALPQYRQHPQFPYLTHPPASSSLDQLNLSRTVVLKYLAEDLTLNELLSEVDHGPIEYCKMFSSPAPAHLKGVSTTQTCYISFINTTVLVSFHGKYGKNAYNLRALRERLRGSQHLRISLNDNAAGVGTNNLSKQDFIKLKTLNYILDFNATRCLVVRFRALPEQLPELRTEFEARCAKYGDFEDFKVSTSEEKTEIKFLVHFTSIDSAIKVYEYHLRRVQIDQQNLIDLDDAELPIMCLSARFHRDRCDRTEITKTSQSRQHSLASPSPTSSPRVSRRPSNRQFQDIPESNGKPDHESSSVIDTPDTAVDDLLRLPEIESADSIPFEPLPEAELATRLANVSLESLNDIHSVSTNVPSEARLALRADLRNGLRMDHSYSYRLDGYSQTQSQYSGRQHVSNSSFTLSAVPSYQYNPDPYNAGNRTLYLGCLHPNTTVEEIANNVRAGGLVESIKFYRSKRMCFITFVDPNIALKFYLNHQVLHQLIIHGNDVNVSWGKNHLGPLNREIALAVTAGASRNVYIGVKAKGEGDNEIKTPLPDEETMRSDFSKFGDLEQINFYHNKDSGFINFMNIMNAIKLVEMFESKNVEKIRTIAGDNGEFYEKYKQFKISYGKDRCGNPPRFSVRKKNRSLEYLRERDTSQTDLFRQKVQAEENNNSINEEAAMVFGISTELHSVSESPTPKDDEGLKDSSPEYLAESTNIIVDLESSPTEPQAEEEVAVKSLGVEQSPDEEECEDDEDDDDDDISIIIGSDITTSSQVPHRRKAHGKPHKIYHHRPDSLDACSLQWNNSRNSSSLSLNSNFAKYYNYHQPTFSPAPSIPQMMYYQQPPQSSQMRPNNYYAGPHQMQGMPPMMQQNSYHYPQHHNNSHYSLSGSQVMAQYLAKSQHDNFVYAASIINMPEEHREFKRTPRRAHRKQSAEDVV